MSSADVIILGGGIAGVSLAAELAGRLRVILIELESQLGRHATGRSAAMYFETYGNEVIQTLTRASRSFFLEPPAGFTDTPLLRPRGLIRVSDASRSHRLAELVRGSPQLSEIPVSEALRSVPILNPGWVAAAASDDSGFDIDVAALTQGYLVQSRRLG